MDTMQALQESFYNDSVDYSTSAHLRHPQLKARLSKLVSTAVGDLHAHQLPLRVLEVGAGHGGYTEVALALGCEVTALEMSRPALEVLEQRFATNSGFTAVLDPAGDLAVVSENFTLVLGVSVLHHIPDYLAFLEAACERLDNGGSVLVLQDPLWYSRVPKLHHRGERAAYLTWRLGRGNIRRGVSSVIRRSTNKLDDSNPGDMVEYHVVRDGVDEQAIEAFLTPLFNEVSVIKYWSTPASVAQRFGERLGWRNTFAVYARGYSGGWSKKAVE